MRVWNSYSVDQGLTLHSTLVQFERGTRSNLRILEVAWGIPDTDRRSNWSKFNTERQSSDGEPTCVSGSSSVRSVDGSLARILWSWASVGRVVVVLCRIRRCSSVSWVKGGQSQSMLSQLYSVRSCNRGASPAKSCFWIAQLNPSVFPLMHNCRSWGTGAPKHLSIPSTSEPPKGPTDSSRLPKRCTKPGDTSVSWTNACLTITTCAWTDIGTFFERSSCIFTKLALVGRSWISDQSSGQHNATVRQRWQTWETRTHRRSLGRGSSLPRSLYSPSTILRFHLLVCRARTSRKILARSSFGRPTAIDRLLICVDTSRPMSWRIWRRAKSIARAWSFLSGRLENCSEWRKEVAKSSRDSLIDI